MLNNVIQRPNAQRLIAALFGASAALGFAPYGYWPIPIISLSVLILMLLQKPAKPFLLGWSWGLGFFGVGISWVHVSIDTFGGMPMPVNLLLMFLLSGYLALYPGLFALTVNKFAKTAHFFHALLTIPAAWLVSEWLRGWIFTGFPWLQLGYSQIDSPLSGFAPIGSVELITLLIAIIASLVAFSMQHKRPLAMVVACILLIAAVPLQQVNWVEKQGNSETSFALVQGNIDQAKKWLPSERWPTLVKYVDMTEENWDADIVIWPEAAIPAFEHELTPLLTKLDLAARKNHSVLITGILNRPSQNVFYNTILTLGDDETPAYTQETAQRYAKHHLLPFGEFVPFESWLRPIAPLFNLPMSSFSGGEYLQPNIAANGRHLTSALCYEILFNEQVRANVLSDTDFILTLSNDAWFGHSNGPAQHMEIARMRARELGRPVIRATNNGITAVTDERGNITSSAPTFEETVLRATVASYRGDTPYQQFGRAPLYWWMIITVFGLVILRRKQN